MIGDTRISLIVAMAENRVIGRDGGLPWRLPADLRRFKQLTLGHPIVMGRRTYESIGRLLPGRTTIIVSRREGYVIPGAIVAGSLSEAISQAARSPGGKETFIVGGAELYRVALPLADRLLITRVASAVEGDTFFPDYDDTAWQLTSDEPYPADERNPLTFRFQEFVRRKPAPAAGR